MRRLIAFSLILFALLAAAMAAAAQERVAGAAPKPLTEAEILKGLAGEIPNKRLATLVREYGVDFSLAPESEERLRTLGADDEWSPYVPASHRRSIQYHPVSSPFGTSPRESKHKSGRPWHLPSFLPSWDLASPCGWPRSITNGFWMGQTLVTQAAYLRVMGMNASYFKEERFPVEQVSWDEARSYCAALGLRLPTEAEWEYAARAGSTAARYGEPDAIAWYNSNSRRQTHPVGQKQPNAWKLFDMLGNVWEWTNDWHDGSYYTQSPSQDPRGPSLGRYRVVRGGSWGLDARGVRVSVRFLGGPSSRVYDFGFRCAGEAFP